MGSLKPGALLIYERANGVITAREFGSSDNLSEWNDVLRAAETNPALQEALDRAIIIYNLSKQNGQ